MQLTQFTDYSLRVLIYLGTHPERKATILEVARYFNLSKNHLMKIVHQLSKKGYIETTRGNGGGMRLARGPALINIGELVHKTEGNLNIVECFHINHQNCPLLPDCTLKSLFNKALDNFMKTLKDYTLADILTNHAPSQKSFSEIPS